MISGVFLDGQKVGGLINSLAILLFTVCVASFRDRKGVG
jgi:hypothetical protein